MIYQNGIWEFLPCIALLHLVPKPTGHSQGDLLSFYLVICNTGIRLCSNLQLVSDARACLFARFVRESEDGEKLEDNVSSSQTSKLRVGVVAR